MDEGRLHVFGQRRRQSVQVHFLAADPFRFHEYLMPVAIGKPYDFVFDRGAVTGTAPDDFTAVQWRAMDVGPDDRMGGLIGPGDMAIERRPFNRRIIERER